MREAPTAQISLPLHYKAGERRNSLNIGMATFVTQTNSIGNVRVLKSSHLYRDTTEIFEEVVTKTNQTGEPAKLAAEIVTYLQQRYDLA